MIESVFFDLDGTLADTAPDLCLALNRLLAEEGRSAFPLSQSRPHISNGVRGLLAAGFGITPDDMSYADLTIRFLRHYEHALCEQTTLFHGIGELLDDLESRGISWGIVTNKPQRFTLPLVEALGLRDRCACIISGDTALRPKPDPSPLWMACIATGVSSARSIYVGDDQRDIVAGRAAGLRTIAASYGYLGVEAPVSLWQADVVVYHPSDILMHTIGVGSD